MKSPSVFIYQVEVKNSIIKKDEIIKKNINEILFILKLIIFFSLIKKIKLPNKISQALEKGK